MAGTRERVHASTVRVAEPAGEPTRGYLTLVVVCDEVSCHALPERGEVTIGRGDRCDVRIDDGSVSRRHAVLRIGERLAIADLGSQNGVSVRGRRTPARQAVEFSLGETIQLGTATVLVQRRPVPAFADELGRRGTLRKAPARPPPGSPFVVASAAMRHLERLVERIAPSDLSVLILGETGVGKEILAETVHRRSHRAAAPFLRLNCAALSESLLESELFGHEKGAFTGAARAKPGLLETAHGGTVFIDEVGELPATIQVKLLRVLEERQVLPVGGLKPRAIDVRFVAATHRDLEGEIARGRFRQDLYFRLNGIALAIPPLRERKDEIEPLARAFVERAAKQAGRAAPELDAAALDALRRFAWPGNIRQLRNVMERALLLAGDGEIAPEHLALTPPATEPGPSPDEPVPDRRRMREQYRAAERRNILEALDRCAGNQTRAAKLLGISRRALLKKLDAYAIARPRKRRPH